MRGTVSDGQHCGSGGLVVCGAVASAGAHGRKNLFQRWCGQNFTLVQCESKASLLSMQRPLYTEFSVRDGLQLQLLSKVS